MAADVETRKLQNLRVIELRNELGKRNLDKTGVKNDLIERLHKALVSEGHDPDTYIFDLDSIEKKTPRSSKRRTMDENDVDKEDSGLNDTSAGDDESKEVKEQDGFSETAYASVDEKESGETKMDKDEKLKTSAEEMKEECTNMKTEPKENLDEKIIATKEKESAEKDVKIEEQNVKNDDTAKEQRVNLAKKIINEESKEKCNDVSKEDNEDSINLTIGEDEVKLFGEEEESSSQEKDVKVDPTKITIEEAEKESQGDSSKSNVENKIDQKTNLKKVSVSKCTGNSRNLWVSGLSSMTRATDLKTLFSKYGKVVAAKIVTNAKTPGSRCYGYVTMLSTEDATVSMQHLHKTELDGRMILVERAKDDGTGPARPKLAKKESDKKKSLELKDEKILSEDKRKLNPSKSAEKEIKSDEKKVREEKKNSSMKDITEETNGNVKAASVKSDKTSTNRDRVNRSRTKEGSRHRSRDSGKPRSGVLTFAQIKEERERHRLREKERALRLEERRRQIERERQREIERRQREEAARLERERIKLKMEREKMKAELLKLEREAQRLERERLQREKEELRRAQLKLEETRRVVKRPLEITRSFEDDRSKRRPPSPERRHVHISSSSSSRKELPSRNNGDRRASPAEYVSRRTYESSVIDVSRKDTTSHSSRDKSSKESSRYDHYSNSHSSNDIRSKEIRHRYPDAPTKSSTKSRHDRYPDPPTKSSGKDSGRYDRANVNENWSRSSGSVSSSVKPFNNMSGSGGAASISSRDAWGTSSSDRKTEQPPWARSTTGSTSDRWASSSTSASGMSMSRGGPIGSSSGVFSSGASYSDTISSMGMMGLSSGTSYSDRFDAYKSNIRKY